MNADLVPSVRRPRHGLCSWLRSVARRGPVGLFALLGLTAGAVSAPVTAAAEQDTLESAVAWPGQTEVADNAVADAFARLRDIAARGDDFPDDGLAWEPAIFGPGLTREAMVATVWDDGAGPALYVGGQLLTAGRHAAFGIARWDGGEWSPLGLGVNGPVRAMVELDGDLIVAGSFTHAATDADAPVTVNNIARWDGSTWSPLGTGFQGPSAEAARVLALTVYEGDLIAGGSWLPDGGQPTSWLARWDGNAWTPLGPGADIDQSVWDLTVFEGDLIAGGSFTTAGGTTANGVARWDGNEWSAFGSGTNSTVIRLAVFDGDLVAGGAFTQAGGNFANRIARWDGSAWSSLGTGLAGTLTPLVRDLDVYDGELIAAGTFTHAGGQSVNNIARWNGTAWAPLAGPAGSGVGGIVGQFTGAVSAVSVVDGTLVAGGEFYTAGGIRANYIAGWDGDAWSPLPEIGTGLVNYSEVNNGSVRAVAMFDGDLVVGGGYDEAAGVPGTGRIARWDGSQWSSLGTGIDVAFPAFGDDVNVLFPFGDDLIVGGLFPGAGGVPGTNLIARWDGDAWFALGTGMSGAPPGLAASVDALIEYEGDLVAGGTFFQASGLTVNFIARWDGSAWSPLGSGMNATVAALALYEGDLIAAGSFTTAGGVAADRIARWDGSAWSPLGSGANARISALAVLDGDLIAAGDFTTAGGVGASRVARWDGANWSQLGGGVSGPVATVSPRVSALTVFGGDLIAAGLFTSAGAGSDLVAVNSITRWDGSRWWPLAGPLGVGSSGSPNLPWLFALGTYDPDGPGPIPERLAVGGFHLLTGGVPSWGLGFYGPPSFSVTPSPLDFGAVIVGQTGGPLSLTLANNSVEVVTVSEVSSPGPPFALGGGSCGATPFDLTPGATCTREVTFAPTDPGAAFATITVAGDAPGGPQTVALQGLGSDGSIAATPDPLDFGAVTVGESAGPLAVTLTNADAVTVEVGAVSTPALPFAAAAGTCGTAPFSLAPAASCTLAFTFGPTAVGSFSDLLEVTHDGQGSPQGFALSGVGAERQLALAPDPLDFGAVPIGETGGPLSLTLSNPGPVAVVVGSVSSPGAPFASTGTTCDATPFVLAPAASCAFEYGFTPAAAGAVSAAVTVVSDAQGSPHTVTLQGEGAGSVIDVAPASLSVTVSQGGSASETLTIANLGNELLEWQVTEEANARGAILRPGGNVTVPALAPPSSSSAFGMAGRAPEAYAAASYADRDAVGDGTTITHSQSLTVLTPNSVACGLGGATLDNHFLRTFTLDDFGLTEGLSVTEVTFGVESLNIAVPVGVNLYTLEGPFLFANLTPIGSATEPLAPQALTLVTVPVSGFAPAGSTLVVELLPPNLNGLGAFWPGSNDFGETAPSYWATSACDHDEPIPYTSAGFPGVHLVMTVTGREPVDCNLPPWVEIEPLGGTVAAGGEQLVQVTFDGSGLEPGGHQANLCLESNDGLRPLTVVPLTMTVTEAGVPSLAFDPPSLDLGEVEVGETGPPQVAMLHNLGDAVATGITFTPPGGGFDTGAGDCGATLPAGESCTVSVTFTPSEPGPAATTLGVNSDQAASAGLDLTGRGLAAGAGFTAVALEVDSEAFVSDGNGIFEPGETAEVAPAWRNDDVAAQNLEGAAADFTGPAGAIYTLELDDADYGLVDPGRTASCRETHTCYRLRVSEPAVRPATLWVATFEETLSDGAHKTWDLHIGDSFADVPRTSPFYRSVETLLHAQVTGGCSDSEYCPTAGSTRGQMPVFVLRALEGADFVPEACIASEEVFTDVPATSALCPWIQELFFRGVVAGCSEDAYCPDAPVNRQQMAIFLLRTLEGDGYTPPACTGEFADVPCSSPFAPWVEELYERGVTGGCGTEPLRYCPTAPVNRQQMAAFVTQTFGLTLYGP